MGGTPEILLDPKWTIILAARERLTQSYINFKLNLNSFISKHNLKESEFYSAYILGVCKTIQKKVNTENSSTLSLYQASPITQGYPRIRTSKSY